MQQAKLNRYEKINLGVKGFFWVAGLLMAGSDSNFMPWVNGLGLVIFAASSFLLGKQSGTSKTRAAGCPGFYRKSGEKEKKRYSPLMPTGCFTTVNSILNRVEAVTE